MRTPRPTSIWMSVTILLTMLLALTCIPTASAAECGSSMKVTLQPNQTDIHGSATLCIEPNHITATVNAENLNPGDAYTTWFAYIDDPTQCGNYAGGTPGVCADQDGFLPANSPAVVFGRMDGAIAEESGHLRFTGNFHDLRFSHGSMVWIIMFGHGPASTADNRFLARQLLTPQLPVLGAPGLGALADGAVGHPVGLAVFNIP